MSWRDAIPRLGIAGTSWRDVDTSVLAKLGGLVRDEGWLASARRDIEVAELCPVATCNRVELAFLTHPGDDHARPLQSIREALREASGGATPELRLRAGDAALEHLVEVAAGLDSAMPGEREIRGQLRCAVRGARNAGLAGAGLERMIHEALRIAARVHEETGLGGGRASLAELAVQRVLARLRATPGAVLLVGVSPMTRRAAARLGRERVELVVANRTASRAAELAALHGGGAVALDALRSATPRVEAVITATGAPEPVLDRNTLERLAHGSPSGRPPILVDLAVPPDADPETARAAGIELVGLDDLVREAERTRERRSDQIAESRAAVARQLARLRQERAERALSPVLRDLGTRYRDTARRGVELLLERDLSNIALQPAEREALLEWADALARRLAHLPTAGLRALSSRCGHDAVEVFLAAGDPKLLDTLAESGESPEPT
ncbi:MAG TPA: hypothetical protein VNB06_02520 [Thermoanaerobaculia bacterium]|nr:hypothetical protein [Thermoanaerobaculia bacterium]